jgi:hypothetical protein
MEPSRSEELLAGSLGDSEAQGKALFSILYQLEQISAALNNLIVMQTTPAVEQSFAPSPAQTRADAAEDGGEEPQEEPVEELAHDPDTGQFVKDNPETPENEHLTTAIDEEADERPPGVAS